MVAEWWVAGGGWLRASYLYQGDEVYLDHVPPPALWGVFGKANARIVDPHVDAPKLGNWCGAMVRKRGSNDKSKEVEGVGAKMRSDAQRMLCRPLSKIVVFERLMGISRTAHRQYRAPS
jgi:hypothetical protein